jgi:hypothetical protein
VDGIHAESDENRLLEQISKSWLRHGQACNKP